MNYLAMRQKRGPCLTAGAFLFCFLLGKENECFFAIVTCLDDLAGTPMAELGHKNKALFLGCFCRAPHGRVD